MINLFGSARRADVARIDRFHWSAWITSVLVSHASRARFLCSEDLIIVALFLWLGSLRVATASHSGGRPAPTFAARHVASVHRLSLAQLWQSVADRTKKPLMQGAMVYPGLALDGSAA
jgi:hypothetical protein